MDANTEKQSNAKPARRRSHTGTVTLLLMVGLVGAAYGARQHLYDSYRLYNYTAPASVVQLADQNGLQPSTRKVFFVNHPQLQEKASFSNACPNGGGEKTIILGCYHSTQNGIFLLKVDDSRLNGVTQVTAAHETLHAAYDRLSRKERQRVDGMLLDYYNNKLQDERIKSTIEGYKKSEPNDVVNEMHSIFGTEIAQLPKSLEAYYAQYFKDRTKVTNFANQYQAEFSSRQAAIKQSDADLAALKQRIGTLETSLDQQQRQITARQQDLVAKRRAGDTAAYNAGVPEYNGLIDDYNRQVRLVQSLVSQYNQLVASRNDVAMQISELSNALSTTATQINQ